MIDDKDTSQLQPIILPLQQWFFEHARVLPWREDATPYRVWISEIMLQQTRVEAVKPYFDRFIRSLPSVQALANCQEDELLKLWEGLGYYNRARNLKVAAQQIMDAYEGELPSEYEELLKLKGIGHYTAGAIASIAYEKPVPAVDGNVLRVISRLLNDDSDIMKQSVRTKMEERLRMLMQENEGVLLPRVFNQALMELGALICIPNHEPHCMECPLQKLCLAHQKGRELELPVKSKAKKRRLEKRTVLILRQDDKVVIRKRENKGLLAGLYEFPNVEGWLSDKEIISYLRREGYEPLRILPLPEAKHIFSHVEWQMIGYMVLLEEYSPKQEKNLFVEIEDIRKTYAVPAAFSKYTELVLGEK